MNWIKCSERLPEVDERVLIATPELVLLGDRVPDEGSPKGWYWFDGFGFWYDDSRITHWMPLPPLPEGE